MQASKAQPDTGQTRRVAVIGGTFAGNKGAAGMLESAVLNLSRRCRHTLLFDVLSIYPKRDRRVKIPDNVRIVPAPPVKLVILLPLLACCYAILGKLRLPRKFLLSFGPLRAIALARVVLDVSGISYVDGRGATIIYNLACNVPAIVVGTPLIKLSQALGPFRKPLNRTAARFVLSRADRIFSRGPETHAHLAGLGLGNTAPAADLAFILNDHIPIPPLPEERYPGISGAREIIGVAPSEVLARYAEGKGADLVGILAGVLNTLQSRTGAHVAVIAHSLLGAGKRSRNNDYHVCRTLYESLEDKENATLVIEDLTPSELRSVIARCSCFIACRFHSMISALCAVVPPIVLAWSHKYHEVMSEFGLEGNVLDTDRLARETIVDSVIRTMQDPSPAKEAIATRLPAVMTSARSQIDYTAGAIDSSRTRRRVSGTAARLYRAFYDGRFTGAFLGYGARDDVRRDCASGGLVSSLILNRLQSGSIDGAVESRAIIEKGRLEFRSLVCTDETSVLDCRTSIYSDFNHAREVIRLLDERRGVFAVVALPCQWRMINAYAGRHPEFREKLGLRIGLWCGHATDRRLIDDFLRLRGIDLGTVERFYYRKGRWRGKTVLEHAGGAVTAIPFKSGYGLLQNLYVDCKLRCLGCTDHFAECSDVSFGDAWLGELKKEPVKHSMAVSFTGRGRAALEEMNSAGDAFLQEVPPELAVDAQKRAVVWHTYGGAGRRRVGKLFGMHVHDCGIRPRWNDYLSAFLVIAAYKAYAGPLRPALLRLPWPAPYVYMLAQKTFLNF